MRVSFKVIAYTPRVMATSSHQMKLATCQAIAWPQTHTHIHTHAWQKRNRKRKCCSAHAIRSDFSSFVGVTTLSWLVCNGFFFFGLPGTHRLMRGQIVHSHKLRQFRLPTTRQIWHVFMLIHNGHTKWPNRQRKAAAKAAETCPEQKHIESMPEAFLWFFHSSAACPTHCASESETVHRESERERDKAAATF